MKKGIGSIVMLLGVFMGIESMAQKPAVVTSNEPGWQKIGETSASFKMQNESIEVLGADEFTAIKLKVTDAPLSIERLQVFYESGEMEEIEVGNELAENAESGVITLKHPDRDISKIAFTYKTAPNAEGDKADVELYGLKTNQPAGSDAYRNEAKETGNEIEREAEETSDEVKSEAKEAGREVEAETEETEGDIERAAEKVGDGVSEGVNDAAAAIKDDKLEDKVGPGGETVYADDNGKFYYINNEGEKIYITVLQLKDKPDDK